MKVVQLLPRAFGKFHLDEPLEFDAGLNVVIGRNDAGKSTLHAFILGMLYGFKDDGRLRVVRTEQFEKYRPWQGREYAGILVYEHEGRLYRIERSFDPDETRIYDGTTGDEITSRFSLDNRREYDFARRHLGLGMREFMNTVWIGQLGSSQEPGLGYYLRTRIAELLDIQDDEPVAYALSLLEQARRSIKGSGHTRAELDMLWHEIADLEEEARRALIREEEIRELVRRAAAVQREKNEVEARIRFLETGTLCSRCACLKRTLDEALELSTRLSQLENRMADLGWAQKSSEESAARLREIEGERNRLFERKKELQERLDVITQRMEHLRSELNALGSLAERDISEADVIARYETLMKAQREMQRLMRLLQDAREVVTTIESEGRMSGYAWLEALNRDYVDNVRYVASQVETVEAQNQKCTAELEQLRAEVEAANPWRNAISIYSLAIALGGVAGAAFLNGETWWWFAAAPAAGSFLTGLLSSVFGLRAKARKTALLRRKEEEARMMSERAAEARRALKGLLAEVRVGTVEELVRLWNDLSSWRERRKAARLQLDKIAELVSEASKDYERARDAFVSLVSPLPSSAAAEPPLPRAEERPRTEIAPPDAPEYRMFAGVGDAEERLLDALRTAVRRAGELKGAIAECEETRLQVVQELQTVEERLCELDRSRAALPEAEDVSSPEELEARLEASAVLREIERETVTVRARLDQVLGGRTLDELGAEVAELESRLGPSLLGGETPEDVNAEASSAELERERDRLSGLEEALKALRESIQARSAEGRPLYEVDEELRAKRLHADALAEEAEALRLAHDVLAEVSGKIKKEFVPALSRRAGDILARITGSKYGEVSIGPELEMTVVMPGEARAARVQSLSTGTADQGFLAIRIALVEMLSGRRDFPMFFDAPFVHYDDERLDGALRVIGDLSKTHQVVIFTHESRILRKLRELELDVNVIDLDGISSK